MITASTVNYNNHNTIKGNSAITGTDFLCYPWRDDLAEIFLAARQSSRLQLRERVQPSRCNTIKRLCETITMYYDIKRTCVTITM